MKTILFQGDSITDASRNRETTVPNWAMGYGYATAVSAILGEHGEYDFYNRGIGGYTTDVLLLRKGNQVVADLFCIAGAMGNTAQLFKITKYGLRLKPGQFYCIHRNTPFRFEFTLS